MATILNTIAASEVGAKIVLELSDEVSVVEFANGRFVIADTSEMADFDEIMPLCNPIKFADDVSREDRIARMEAKYIA